MLDLTILAVGAIKNSNLRGEITDYLKRLKPYARIKVVEVESESFSADNKVRAKAKEEERLLSYLNRFKETEVYLLAERGEEFSSPTFADFLEINQPLILVIGGALGFSDELYDRYPHLSLSKLTFPHELARLILCEQLYRAVTILNQKAYHY